MRQTAALVALLCSVAFACGRGEWPQPTVISSAQFAKEFADWRSNRHARLVTPGSGPVTWVGLWELHGGTIALGADSTLPIVLRSAAVPGLAGTLTRSGSVVRFDPAPNADIRAGDSSGARVRTALTLKSDRTDSATVLAISSLRMRVHGESGTDRLWLRVWDVAHPTRERFVLPASFTLETAWRVAAVFVPFRVAREFRVADVVGGTQTFRAPGELVFRLDGRQHRLTAFADSISKDYFVMFWDSTATTTTYQGGRYLRVPFPDSTGWTVVDFNRAYNPPCVFTPYSTCALPPRENRLALSVVAGEKRLP